MMLFMVRRARASVGGLCYHVLNRGNGRSEVFHKDGDYAAFLKLLTQANDHVRSRIESLASKHQSRPALRLTVVASRHGHTTGPGNNLASTRQTMEKSNKVMQAKLAEMAEAGELPDDSKAYYQMWIKILEGHYMTLFKSPEYAEAMGQTLKALEDYKMTSEKVVEDILEMFPVPTQKDMDELYKEIYLLKKKVKALEKEKV